MPEPPFISREQVRRISKIVNLGINENWPFFSHAEDRENILQDVLINLWKNHREAFSGNYNGMSANTFFTIITNNVCRARKRKMDRQEKKLGRMVALKKSDKRKLITPDLDIPELNTTFSPKLEQALKRLPLHERQIFLFYIVGGESFSTIGKRFGKYETSIRNSYIRARERMQRFMGAPVFSPRPRKSPTRKPRL